jgi:hypothetical protein
VAHGEAVRGVGHEETDAERHVRQTEVEGAGDTCVLAESD